jgi:hypothetical protein
VIVGESGLVEGSIRGRDVVVLGRVRGDVHATGHLEIGPKGKVLGDITVQTFRMHKGGVFRGTSSMPGADDVKPELAALSGGPPSLAAHRGRTLPPPTGGVPPPPSLAELVPIPAIIAPPPSPIAGPDEAVSQERIVTSSKPETRATGS